MHKLTQKELAIDFFTKTFTIARYTFMEIFKSKILLNVFILGIVLLLLTFVASEFTYGTSERVALDFGLALSSLASIIIAIFMGVGLISKEVENRTVYIILSRPISRSSFILGKMLGLSNILLLNTLVLGALSLLMFFHLGGEFSPMIAWAYLFNIFEMIILLMIVVLLSIIVNPIMTVTFGISFFFVGHTLPEVQNTVFVNNNPTLKALLISFNYFLPNFHKLNIKDFLLYKQTLPSEFLWNSCFYAISYILVLAFLIFFVFAKKNLD